MAQHVPGCSGPCAINEGYDSNRHAEYIEVECGQCSNLDNVAARLWRMTAQSFTAAAWNGIQLEFVETDQRYVYNAGSFISQRWKSVKKALEHILEKYLKYFYARGFSVEPLQDEYVPRDKPQPRKGFIDLLLSNMASYIYSLDRLRGMTSIQLKSGTPRTVNVLLADLGDKGIALHEAIETLYSVSIDRNNVCRVSLNLNSAKIAQQFAELSGDFVGWLHRLFVFEILRKIAEGSIELLARWPSIAIAHYGQQKDPNDTRFIEYTVITGEDLLLAYHSISSTAEQLGLSARRLLRFLEGLPACILEAFREGLLRDNEVSGLVSRLAPLYDSVLQGFVDRDVLYEIVRLLYSKDVSGIPSCRSAAVALGGW